MEINIIQAVLIGLVCALTALDGDWLGESKFREPLVTGFLVGLILGDVRTGVVIGGQLQLIWMGATGIGLSAQLDIGMGGTLGCAFAMMTGSGAEVAMAVGLPISILMQFINALKMTFFSGMMHKADSYAQEANTFKLTMVHYMCGFVTSVLYLIPSTIMVYFGSGVVDKVVALLPDWAMNGLGAVSSLLPALGFAMLMQILMEGRLIPFFIVGFVAAAYTGLDMMAITLIAVAIAMVIYMIKIDTLETTAEEDEL